MASSRPATAPAPGRPAPEPRRGRSDSPLLGRVADAVAIALLAILGLGSGVSAIADGFYDLTVWGPITVAMLALALAAAAVAPGRPRLVPALAVGGLVALWAWSRLSASWAESADQALVATGRWALYAAMLAALLLLMRTRRDRWLPLAFATAGVMVVAGYVLLRMLEGDVESLFFGGRLRDPLGYVNGQAGYFLLGFWPCVALAEQTRSRVLAGLGAGCAVILGALLVLSDRRPFDGTRHAALAQTGRHHPHMHARQRFCRALRRRRVRHPHAANHALRCSRICKPRSQTHRGRIGYVGLLRAHGSAGQRRFASVARPR